jgi:hypothetical protein
VKSPADLGKAMAELLARRKPSARKPIGPPVLIIEPKKKAKTKVQARAKPAPKKAKQTKKSKPSKARRAK